MNITFNHAIREDENEQVITGGDQYYRVLFDGDYAGTVLHNNDTGKFEFLHSQSMDFTTREITNERVPADKEQDVIKAFSGWLSV